MSQEPIHVVVSMDFSDEIMAKLRAISPRLQIERHFPNVPESVWPQTEILYTQQNFPEPAQAPRLRWLQAHSAGLDTIIKQPIMKAEDVEITTTSGIHTVQMSEFCLTMMLAFNYKLLTSLQLQAKAEWPKNPRDVFVPNTLRGQTLGIAGYGSIGRELARIASALGMTVLATKRNLKETTDHDGYTEAGTGDPEGVIPARLYPPEALASMVTLCDWLVVTTPLVEGAPPVVDQKVLDAMKKTAVLINVARGAVVDEAALITALSSKKIAGAALDVFKEEPLPTTSPLWNLDNVIITPHISGNSTKYHEKAAALFADNLQRYLENKPLLNRLNRKRGY
ncbi:MAG: D-2-hydroxyacid dehydrogenase [Anaerolineae bacterium]|nr:D-2-hydroxyacid dehydrogenase [Anaerolineae bacterium]